MPEAKTSLQGTREDYMFVSPDHMSWGTRIVHAVTDPTSRKNTIASVRVDMDEAFFRGQPVGFVNLCDIPAVRLGRTIRNPINGKDEVIGPELARELLVRHSGFGRDFLAFPDWAEEKDMEGELERAIEKKKEARRNLSQGRLIKAGVREFQFSDGKAEEDEFVTEEESKFDFEEEPEVEDTPVLKDPPKKTTKKKLAAAGA